jgi:hypothetical protein
MDSKSPNHSNFSKKSNSKKNNSLKKTYTCQGCKENQPNQLAHMDYGGCLYES